MTLPESKELPVNLLAACFNRTAAAYKYYWLLSILQAVESGSSKVSKRELFARMISNAWYTVNYFNVSFGKQDLIQDTILQLNKIESITIDEKRERVFHKLLNSKNLETGKLLRHFNKNVPHWFLSPWFPPIGKETDAAREKRIYAESQKFEADCLYALHVEHIEINPKWQQYLMSNVRVLKDFCFWNLAVFLQSKNPNVPDIPNKIIKPAKRSSLLKQRTEFWDLVMEELGSVKCIYTGEELTKGNYAVEHFIPYSFVSHDLIWNLIPAEKSFNSSKSNKLPILEKHFQPFYLLQEHAYEIIKRRSPRSRFLEEYLTVFHNQEERLTEKKFLEIIQPLVAIASNNGFHFLT